MSNNGLSADSKIIVSVPATSANLGPGFDLWGLAFKLRNEFVGKPVATRQGSVVKHVVRYEPQVKDTADEKALQQMPLDDRNLFSKAYLSIFEKRRLNPVAIDVEIIVRIPMERGLGSSSTAILAGMVMANEIIRRNQGQPFSMEEIFEMACTVEGHPDNIAPALWGGWILSLYNSSIQKFLAFPLKLRAPVKIAGIVPHLTLSTDTARESLPTSFSRFDMIQQSGCTALMTHLLEKENWSEAERKTFHLALRDRIHQTARAQFIPGMNETFEAWRKMGCLGAFLSGAGTCLLGFWPKEQNIPFSRLGDAMFAAGVGSRPIELEVDNLGLTVDVT